MSTVLNICDEKSLVFFVKYKRKGIFRFDFIFGDTSFLHAANIDTTENDDDVPSFGPIFPTQQYESTSSTPQTGVCDNTQSTRTNLHLANKSGASRPSTSSMPILPDDKPQSQMQRILTLKPYKPIHRPVSLIG